MVVSVGSPHKQLAQAIAFFAFKKKKGDVKKESHLIRIL